MIKGGFNIATWNELARRKIMILKVFTFFTDFMDADLPDNKKFLEELKLFSGDLQRQGFTKRDLKLLKYATYLSTIPKEKRYDKLFQWLVAELASEIIIFEIVRNPLGKDLKDFYKNIYQEVFPEEEQEDLRTFMRYITRENLLSKIANVLLRNEYGDKIKIKYYLLVVKIKGIIAGGAIFYTLNTKRISFVILEYIMVLLDRFKDIPGLSSFYSGEYRIKLAAALLNRCKSYAIKDAIRDGPGQLSFIMGEANDPVKMKNKGILEEDVINPVSRLRLYNSVGFRFLDFPWIQPTLGKGKKPVDYLYLMIVPVDPKWSNNINSSEFRYALLTYLASWKGIDTKKDRTVMDMKGYLDTYKSPVTVRTFRELNIPDQIIEECNKIEWRVKEGIKN